MPTIVVCLKQAIDVTELRVDSATQRPIITNVPRKISDFDKNALEEAVKLKEKLGGEVVVVTVGAMDAKLILREALAMGGDRAYLLSDPSFEHSDTLAISYVLAKGIEKIGTFDLIICGEASIDSYSGQIGPRLAERLDIPQVTHVKELSIDGDTAIAERNLEDRHETVKAKIPVLLTVTKEINEPRIPSLMAIMKASKKEITLWNAEDLKVVDAKVGEVGSAIQILGVLAPKMDRKRIVVEAETAKEVAEKLAEALVKEGVVGR